MKPRDRVTTERKTRQLLNLASTKGHGFEHLKEQHQRLLKELTPHLPLAPAREDSVLQLFSTDKFPGWLEQWEKEATELLNHSGSEHFTDAQSGQGGQTEKPGFFQNVFNTIAGSPQRDAPGNKGEGSANTGSDKPAKEPHKEPQEEPTGKAPGRQESAEGITPATPAQSPRHSENGATDGAGSPKEKQPSTPVRTEAEAAATGAGSSSGPSKDPPPNGSTNSQGSQADHLAAGSGKPDGGSLAPNTNKGKSGIPRPGSPRRPITVLSSSPEPSESRSGGDGSGSRPDVKKENQSKSPSQGDITSHNNNGSPGGRRNFPQGSRENPLSVPSGSSASPSPSEPGSEGNSGNGGNGDNNGSGDKSGNGGNSGNKGNSGSGGNSGSNSGGNSGSGNSGNGGNSGSGSGSGGNSGIGDNSGSGDNDRASSSHGMGGSASQSHGQGAGNSSKNNQSQNQGGDPAGAGGAHEDLDDPTTFHPAFWESAVGVNKDGYMRRPACFRRGHELHEDLISGWTHFSKLWHIVSDVSDNNTDKYGLLRGKTRKNSLVFEVPGANGGALIMLPPRLYRSVTEELEGCVPEVPYGNPKKLNGLKLSAKPPDELCFAVGKGIERRGDTFFIWHSPERWFPKDDVITAIGSRQVKAFLEDKVPHWNLPTPGSGPEVPVSEATQQEQTGKARAGQPAPSKWAAGARVPATPYLPTPAPSERQPPSSNPYSSRHPSLGRSSRQPSQQPGPPLNQDQGWRGGPPGYQPAYSQQFAGGYGRFGQQAPAQPVFGTRPGYVEVPFTYAAQPGFGGGTALPNSGGRAWTVHGGSTEFGGPGQAYQQMYWPPPAQHPAAMPHGVHFSETPQVNFHEPNQGSNPPQLNNYRQQPAFRTHLPGQHYQQPRAPGAAHHGGPPPV